MRRGHMALKYMLAGCGDPYQKGTQACEQEPGEKAIELLRQVTNLDKNHEEASELATPAKERTGKQGE